MAEKTDAVHTDAIERPTHHGPIDERALETEAPMAHIAELQAAKHIDLTWKSWMVVFVSLLHRTSKY